MNRNEVRRKSFFDLYSKNLDNFLKSINRRIGYSNNGKVEFTDEPLYICPLCKEIFSKIHIIEQPDNFLTLEDIPPKSLGGKPALLTCKLCNNKSGNKLDKLIKENLHIHQVAEKEPSSSFPVTFIFKKGSIKGELRNNKDKNQEIFINQSSNPYLIKHLIDSFDGEKFKMRVKINSDRLFKIAILRIGYLYAFSFLGYSFLYDANIERIRRQIMSRNEKILDEIPVIEIPISDENIGLNFIKKPQNMRCYVITFKIHLKNFTKTFAVLLPGPGEIGIANLNSALNSLNKVNFELSNIPTNIKNLENKDHLHDYIHIWKNLR